jgi:hypothetical protein
VLPRHRVPLLSESGDRGHLDSERSGTDSPRPVARVRGTGGAVDTARPPSADPLDIAQVYSASRLQGDDMDRDLSHVFEAHREQELPTIGS